MLCFELCSNPPSGEGGGGADEDIEHQHVRVDYSINCSNATCIEYEDQKLWRQNCGFSHAHADHLDLARSLPIFG